MRNLKSVCSAALLAVSVLAVQTLPAAASEKLFLTVSDRVDQSNPDVAAIRDNISNWQELFSPQTEVFSLAGYEHLFEHEPGKLLIYDDFARPDSLFYGYERYKNTWEEQINTNFPNLILQHIEIDNIGVSGDMAWSAFTWFGSVTIDGEKFTNAQHATHVWHKVGDSWKIIHEHLNGGVIEGAEPAVRPENEGPDGAIVHYR